MDPALFKRPGSVKVGLIVLRGSNNFTHTLTTPRSLLGPLKSRDPNLKFTQHREQIELIKQIIKQKTDGTN